MADTEFMSPEERAAKKKQFLLDMAAPAPAVSQTGSLPADGSLASRVGSNSTAITPETAPAAAGQAGTSESAAPTQKEPSVPMVTPGSSPPPSPEVGGVNTTVADSQAEVNKILGRKPSAGKLRAAVDAYEKYNADLKAQGADTSDIDASLAQAKSAYEEKANRNEMLSLVQMIAQGFAKLAAYNYGSKHGRYIADQVNVPSVDYEKRTDRAMEERKLDEAGLEKKRSLSERQAERDYQAGKDKGSTLKERIGAEESALGRETQMYGDELSAARSRNSDALREKATTDREMSAEEKANRAYGAKLFDNLQQDEALLTRATTVLKDEKKAKAVNVDQLATQAGIDEARLAEIKQEATDAAAAEDTVFTDEDRLVREKTHAGILGEIRKKLDAVRQRKVEADQLMRTGKAPEKQSATPPPGRVIKSKSTGETRPYTDELWKKISASPQAADFTVTGQ